MKIEEILFHISHISTIMSLAPIVDSDLIILTVGLIDNQSTCVIGVVEINVEYTDTEHAIYIHIVV